ncbi:FRIGIDA interacting protein 1 [Hibiscus syriacus]|uniref:FRIGIDA interacting protein 1 n=1 Tax=Hibiscus syriacus TaxID=106335 RepID=A0A6A3C6W2_HIBSY|nr:FRIGIDA interacting protein 1 [Hibiscus syriacus]
MKGREFNPKPNFESGVICKKNGHFQEDNFEYRVRPRYGVGLHMTLFSFTTRASRVRPASKHFIPHNHVQFHGGSHPQDVRVVQQHDAWTDGHLPDSSVVGFMISAFGKAGNFGMAKKLFAEIQSDEGKRGRERSPDVCAPDVVTYTSVISGYCKLGKMGEVSALFNEMISSGTMPTAVTFNVLINGFGKVGDMLSAKSMYEKMPSFGCVADVVTFTSLIDGYCRNGDVYQSLQLWNAMKARNIPPNVYTFAITINALCKKNRLQNTRLFGNLDEANLIVVEMEEKKCYPDIVTFTILIIGHCMKGKMLEAIGIFNKMSSVGCTPDGVTVHSLASCPFKAGMPIEASRVTTIVSRDMKLASLPLDDNVSFGDKLLDI